MAIQVNLRHLESDESLRLQGQLSVEELDANIGDEMVRALKPLDYDFTVDRSEAGLLLQGKLSIVLDCGCVRCLKRFEQTVRIDPWCELVPLEGEDAAPVINDCVDLTPYIREDILLEFPQHPLCDQECRGLPQASRGEPEKPTSSQTESGASAWAELNKLKF